MKNIRKKMNPTFFPSIQLYVFLNVNALDIKMLTFRSFVYDLSYGLLRRESKEGL